MIVAWVTMMTVAVVSVVRRVWRYGSRGLASASLLVLGVFLMLAFIPVGIGLADKGCTAGSWGLWIAIAIGCLGGWLTVLGSRAVERKPFGPGECQQCGYDVGGLALRTEGGREATGVRWRS